MRRYLIVANQTLAGGHLVTKVRELADHGPCAFHLLVPATAAHVGAWSEGQAHAVAEERLRVGLARMADLGLEATGEVGDDHPVYAVQDVLMRGEAFDAIIVSTLPEKVSRWLRADLVRRVAGFGLPVIHIVGQPEPVTI